MQSHGINFVEGEVEDIIVDYGHYGRSTMAGLKYVSIRLRIGEDRAIDVRFKGYTGPISILKGHKIRAYGKWVSGNVFLAKRLEDLTTGEWWEAKGLTPFYIVFLVGFIAVFAMMMYLVFSPSVLFTYGIGVFHLIFTIVIVFFLAVILLMILQLKGSYKVIG